MLECKQRTVNTPEVTEALDFLEPHIRLTWLIPQYRHEFDGPSNREQDREGQQQVLCPALTASGLRNPIID
jgi:hypothetical protein